MKQFGSNLLRGGPILWAAIVVSIVSSANGQELEPRRWAHLPVGSNFAGIGYGYTTGDIFFDPVTRIEDVVMEMHSGIFGYIRSFELLKKTARIELTQGYHDARWKGLLDGEPASTSRMGISDTTVRFSMNLLGAPPLKGKEFADYRKSVADGNTTLGVGLEAKLPTGYYLEDKLLNIGNNRFTFRPQVGVEHNRGNWTFELTGDAWFFTENDEFFAGNTLEQDPIYAAQTHVVYTFRPGLWVGAGIAYGLGGQSTLNEMSVEDSKENVAWGASLGIPINPKMGFKIGYIALRTRESVGGDIDSYAAGFSVMW